MIYTAQENAPSAGHTFRLCERSGAGTFSIQTANWARIDNLAGQGGMFSETGVAGFGTSRNVEFKPGNSGLCIMEWLFSRVDVDGRCDMYDGPANRHFGVYLTPLGVLNAIFPDATVTPLVMAPVAGRVYVVLLLWQGLDMAVELRDTVTGTAERARHINAANAVGSRNLWNTAPAGNPAYSQWRWRVLSVVGQD